MNNFPPIAEEPERLDSFEEKKMEIDIGATWWEGGNWPITILFNVVRCTYNTKYGRCATVSNR